MEKNVLAATDPLLGALVRLNVDGSKYTGIVQRIERSGNPYLSLRLCSDGTSGKLNRPGRVMDFYGDELKHMQLIAKEENVPPALKKPAAPRNISLPEPRTSRRAPVTTSMSDSDMEDYLECRSSTYDRPVRRPVSKAEWLQRLREEPARPIRPAEHSHRPSPMDADYLFVAELGEKFKTVILTLAESSSVGVTIQGTALGRQGEASVIAMSCRKGVYIFDVVQLGLEASMEAGLKEIFESPHVLKIIHDCRHVSDFLHHKLDITLVNVFDTQAADWMIRRAEGGGMVPIHVNSLRFCLQRYLQLYLQEVRFCDTMNEALMEDEDVWMKRPLDSFLLDCACRSVHYLPELHGVMLQSLLSEFVQAVDLYLGLVRDQSDEDITNGVVNTDVLPVLRREFAINAGTRNYAAPGRATSPERDGLHKVPTYDINPTRDREVLDNFLTDHRERFADSGAPAEFANSRDSRSRPRAAEHDGFSSSSDSELESAFGASAPSRAQQKQPDIAPQPATNTHTHSLHDESATAVQPFDGPPSSSLDNSAYNGDVDDDSLPPLEEDTDTVCGIDRASHSTAGQYTACGIDSASHSTAGQYSNANISNAASTAATGGMAGGVEPAPVWRPTANPGLSWNQFTGRGDPSAAPSAGSGEETSGRPSPSPQHGGYHVIGRGGSSDPPPLNSPSGIGGRGASPMPGGRGAALFQNAALKPGASRLPSTNVGPGGRARALLVANQRLGL